MPKQFAFFLPQFHRIPENDKWWGSGFTEWVSVKKAKPLYKGHIQPKLPLNEYYYNLLDKQTVEWQTELMHKYHIDGMIYYHYYFKGKLLLEKPAENLLKWKDVKQPFFFCWANHSWVKSWEGTKELLVDMEYGDERDWESHFNYLLPFFKDERYEKRNNKPVFMIFESSFSEKKNMISYFDKKCKENGFAGICLIETWKEFNGVDTLDSKLKEAAPETDFIFAREPGFSRNHYIRSKKHIKERIIRGLRRRAYKIIGVQRPEIYDGDALYKEKIDFEIIDKRLIHGIFFEWDNTPRHSSRGYIISPPSKEKFMQYMDKISNEEYVFINAWNEWAEGMMLEPTMQKRFCYLEWISEWVEKINDYKHN